MKKLVLNNISLSYKKHSKELDAFNLTIDKLLVKNGEFFTLIGESGCGKTTALRIIAGLEKPSSGSVFLGDRDITDVQPEKRGIGMVFQKPLLFPHMSVFENLEFALKIRKVSAGEIKKKIKEILIEMDLSGFESKYPRELSGGESQRVSLARSLILDPEILLMDEPFSALDVNTRLEMQKLIKKLHLSRNMTIIFVTHDLEEAFSLSDRLAIVNNGLLVQVDRPSKLYLEPKNLFVANFIGVANVYGKEELNLLFDKYSYDNIIEKSILSSESNSKIGFRAKNISIDYDSNLRDFELVYIKFKGDIWTLHFEKNGVCVVVDLPNNYDMKFEIGYLTSLSFDYNQIINIKG